MNVKDIVVSVFSVAIKVIVIIIVGMFIFKYAQTAYDYGYRIFSEEPVSSGEGREIEVSITADMDVKEIGTALENKGLIRDGKLFYFQERLSENHGKIQPGTYTLSTAMTAEEMIAVMAQNAAEINPDEEQEIDNNFINQESEEDIVFDDESMEVSDSDEVTGVEGFEPVEEVTE